MTPAPCEAPGLCVWGGGEPAPRASAKSLGAARALASQLGGRHPHALSAAPSRPSGNGAEKPEGSSVPSLRALTCGPVPPGLLRSALPPDPRQCLHPGTGRERVRGGARGPAPAAPPRERPCRRRLRVAGRDSVCVRGSVCVSGMCRRLRVEALLSPGPAPSTARSSRPGITAPGRVLPGQIPSSPSLGLERLGVPQSVGNSLIAWPSVVGGVRAPCSQALLRIPGSPPSRGPGDVAGEATLARCPGLHARRGLQGILQHLGLASRVGTRAAGT